MAHLFHTLHEQNYIAHVIGYASCTGVNADRNAPHCTGSAATSIAGGATTLFALSAILFQYVVTRLLRQ